MLSEKVLDMVQVISADLSFEHACKIADALDSHRRIGRVLRSKLHQISIREVQRHQIDQLLELLQEQSVSPIQAAYALKAAARMNQYHRERQQLSLLWSGPDSQHLPMRRNEQGLLDTIRAARETLQVVSFAVYKIERVKEELLVAIGRGVEVFLYLESPKSKLSYDPRRALGADLNSRCTIYEWPLVERRKNTSGKSGSLHAKIALADDHMLFLSSANLTDYAMNFNMEMGVLIEGGEQPEKVATHLADLVERGVFRPI